MLSGLSSLVGVIALFEVAAWLCGLLVFIDAKECPTETPFAALQKQQSHETTKAESRNSF